MLQGAPVRQRKKKFFFCWNLICVFVFQDPTAGGLSSDISVWFLDETSLQENINKTLHRFCQPTPQVVGYEMCLCFD